jgi:serine protease
MLAVNGNLTPEQLIARLQSATQPFPVSLTAPMCHVPSGPNDLQTSECSCTTQTCGAGMANANLAVMEAQRPIAALVVRGVVQAGSAVTLDASGSAAACHASVASWAWTVSQPTTNPPTIQNANSASASIVAPTAPDTYTLMLTVTDNAGRSDTASVVLTSSSVQTSAPANAGGDACLSTVSYTAPPPQSSSASAPSGGGHGGGGALDVLSLLALASIALGYCNSRCAASSQVRCARW